jgi:hypothetical protein
MEKSQKFWETALTIQNKICNFKIKQKISMKGKIKFFGKTTENKHTKQQKLKKKQN